MGFGVNLVTGDYSQGAAGLWIENGELAYPVEEITIAGNLKDMYRNISAIGNDLIFRSSSAAPTLRDRRHDHRRELNRVMRLFPDSTTLSRKLLRLS